MTSGCWKYDGSFGNMLGVSWEFGGGFREFHGKVENTLVRIDTENGSDWITWNPDSVK